MGTDGYRVPARKKFFGTDEYREPGKFSLVPTPDKTLRRFCASSSNSPAAAILGATGGVVRLRGVMTVNPVMQTFELSGFIAVKMPVLS